MQVLQRHQTEIADGEVALGVQEDVLRLEILVGVARLPQGGQRVAQIDPEVQRRQVGHGLVLEVNSKGSLFGHEQIDVEADALPGLDLEVRPGGDAAVFAEGLEPDQLAAQVLRQTFVILIGGSLVGDRAGQDQGLGLDLGFRDGNMLEDEGLARLDLFQVVAIRSTALAELLQQLHTVQQRRNKGYFRHAITPCTSGFICRRAGSADSTNIRSFII